MADKEISRIVGEKTSNKKSLFAPLVDVFSGILEEAFGVSMGGNNGDDQSDGFRMLNLKPVEKKRIEAIQMKASKLSYRCKIRVIYIAKKDVMNKSKAVNGFFGWVKQFAAMDLNNLKYDKDYTATRAEYFFVKYRIKRKKRAIMTNYKSRSDWAGRLPMILNIEELATLWHFPLESAVKAPLVQKAPGRKAKPPVSLPISEEVRDKEELFASGVTPEFMEETMATNKNGLKAGKEKEDLPPANLPIV